MADEQRSAIATADHLNELLEHGVRVFEETFERNIKNFLQSGYLPFTQPLTGKERQAFLQSPEAMQQAAEMMQSQEVQARGQGTELMAEIMEARNGQSAG
ncbi:hypothetical protein LCGC14_1364030 [marine sediment metagenome]|uniref:Uncharacterized protein n=1 Tax=marine sediment metagenome TaxID=412755 RepID=A0A0F9K7B5_9ZZZZ